MEAQIEQQQGVVDLHGDVLIKEDSAFLVPRGDGINDPTPFDEIEKYLMWRMTAPQAREFARQITIIAETGLVRFCLDHQGISVTVGD